MSEAHSLPKPVGFQVAVSSLTLGTLYEAILAFSSQDRFEKFWPSVCKNTRWLIPSRRMSILLSHNGGSFAVAGLFEQGKYQLPPQPRNIAGSDGMSQVLTCKSAQWFEKPADRFKTESNDLTDWLFRDRPDLLFVLPMRTKERSIGTLVFATGSVQDTDRAMLNTLGTIYALHAAMTYRLICITEERRQMKERLIMQEKMASLGSLAAGVAHEANTPIGAIISAADVSTRCIQAIHEAIESIDAAEQMNPKLQRASTLLLENNKVIAEAGRRISKMVQSLKNFARLDQAEFQRADIHDGIETTLQLVGHEFKDKVTLIRQYGKIPPIDCYPSQLNQVFMNLFVNAAHSIEERGTVKVKTVADDRNVYIKLSDSGKGIPADKIDRIFEPGFTSKGGLGVGTGLGLSICYNIIQKHNGTITVKSEVGRGTEFTLTLPKKRAAE